MLHVSCDLVYNRKHSKIYITPDWLACLLGVLESGLLFAEGVKDDRRTE